MTYSDFIRQTYDWPQEEFHTEKNQLFFHGVNLMEVVKTYGTPLRFTFLPKIKQNIKLAKKLFQHALDQEQYPGDYHYAYCTKSSHFRFVLEEVLKQNCHLETSSAYDLLIVQKLLDLGKLDADKKIFCNGYKRPLYTRYICQMRNQGHKWVIPILDNMEELQTYEQGLTESYPIGLRVAANEEPDFEFYTSRLGIRYQDLLPFYKEHIAKSEKAQLSLLHFFINTGIRDDTYFWSELNRFVESYASLRKECESLKAIDIGGGLPIKYSLDFDFDYQQVICQIVQTIKTICEEKGVPCPDIITEFGSFTVGESGGLIYSILSEKLQNDVETWYMTDGSFINHLPDSWAINQRFIMLALNNWDRPYHKVNLGGLTCDSLDYYNREANGQDIFLPKKEEGKSQYIAFFHTGAYQDALGGYGGIQHCLVPAPKHVLLDKNGHGELLSEKYAEEQDHQYMLRVLGYED